MTFSLFYLLGCKNNRTELANDDSGRTDTAVFETGQNGGEDTQELISEHCQDSRFSGPFSENPDEYVVVDSQAGYGHFTSIQAALDYSQSSQIQKVYVCPGEYNEKVNIFSQVDLIGIAGADETVIDPSPLGQDGSVMQINDSALVQGFTITGAQNEQYCYYGGGIKIGGLPGQGENHVVIQNNIIRDNTACKVGAIHLSGFSNGSEEVDIEFQIRNNILANNVSSTVDTGGVHISCARVSQNAQNEITNNVFYHNEAIGSSGVGALILSGSADESCEVDVRNNIFSHNIAKQLPTIYLGAGQIDFSYNNLVENQATSDFSYNTSSVVENVYDYADCMTSPETGDFTLTNDSLCQDQGDPNLFDTDGSRSDLGAYGGPDGDW